MTNDWKVHWEKYLTKKYGDKIPEGKFLLNIGEIDFYISPLLGTTSESFRAIQKHNEKHRIFG
jgi:hypothetical protein